MADNTFTLTLEKFHAGYSPLAFNNSLTEFGSSGHASVMQNIDVVNGEYLTQGPGLANLTNGTQAGAVTEQIQFIMDKATADDVSWAFGDTKLFKLSSTAVVSGDSISGCEEGESLQVLKGSLYGFYNKSSGGDIFKMPLSTEVIDADWGSTIPTGAASLQNAPHPSDKKEDIMVFGNGRYAGTYIVETNTLTVDKLDFGNDVEVADVLYSNGYWHIATNAGVTGTNRAEGQIYLYDGAALVNTLDDEAGVGMQRIGFLYRINGIIYVAYQDLSSTGFIIGYISGRSITPLQRFTGTLPNFQQKTLYKNTILFLSSGLVFSAGSIIGELPYQLSQIADGGYGTVGAIAAPFGTPIVSSTDGGSNFRLAKFSGYDTDCSWKSIIFPLVSGLQLGYIDSVTVLTKALGAGASCSLTVEANQGVTSGTAQTINTTGRTRHHFTNLGLASIQDFRIALDFSEGSASNDCAIRKIIVHGHFNEA